MQTFTVNLGPCGCCSGCLNGIRINYSASHCCDAARYNLYITAQGGNRVNIGKINLNGCSVVTDGITITKQHELQILAGGANCCLIEVDLDCDLLPTENGGWGPGTCHPDLATLTIVAPDNSILFSGSVGENSKSVDVCPSE